MLDARELGRLTGREAEDRTSVRLEDQILRAIGEHRQCDENREAARDHPPHTCQGIAERCFGVL